MSELKAETIVPQGTTITLQMYPKGEVDKAIADLEESHKKEVEQLLMEIVKLKEFSAQCQSAARTLQRKLRYNKWTIDEILLECQYACNQLKVIQNENEGNENNDEDEAGFIARLKIPFKFMGKELKFGEYNTKECGSYYYENILGGVLHIIARTNYFECRNEVVIMYSNEENFKRSNVRVLLDEERFCKEGLKHIFGRMIRDFAMSAVAAEEENKGEEK